MSILVLVTPLPVSLPATVSNYFNFEGSGYTTGSGFLVLHAIQPVKPFARLIGDSQPF